jgi:proteasome lid subunit RPN8/RPN11
MYMCEELFKDILAHVKQQYPKEGCGILAGTRTENNELHVCKVYRMSNISNSPETCYFMNPEEQLTVIKEIRKSGMEIVGIYHSHSNTSAYPSKKDCELAFYPEVDYVIISLKDYHNPDMRAFRIVDGKIIEDEIKLKEN